MAAVKSSGALVGQSPRDYGVILITRLMFLAPIYWIASTAFKPRALATTVPPTVFFQPEITPFIKLFTKRVQTDQAGRSRRLCGGALVGAAHHRQWRARAARRATNVQLSGYPSRFMNSLIIAITSTVLAVGMGTFTAYGFSRFKIKGEADLLFFILSTRMLPPIVVAIPMFLMYRAVGMTDTHIGLIILYTAFNLSFSVWLMKGLHGRDPEGI